MQNKIAYAGIVIALLISLIGISMTANVNKEIKKRLSELNQKFSSETQRLDSRIPPYVPTGEAVGYVIEFENGSKFYISGDTGLSAEMKVIGDFYKPDVAILDIGDMYNMGYKEAAYAAKLVSPARYIIPMHYGTYPLLDQSPNKFLNKLEDYGLRDKALVFKPGEEKEVLGVKATWLGHASWQFVSPEGKVILVDPAMTYNAKWPQGLKDISKFKKVDLILITHGHFDHMTVEDMRKWEKAFHPTVIVEYELGVWLGQYLDKSNILSMLQGATADREIFERSGIPTEKIGGIKVHMVPAVHASSATPVGTSPF